MLGFLLATQQPWPSLPGTVALAAVALLGYLVGRQGRRPAPAGQADLEQALDDARRLERITDEMLVATRQALNHCQQLKIHYPSRQSAVDAVFAND
jgi:hypothetical protein